MALGLWALAGFLLLLGLWLFFGPEPVEEEPPAPIELPATPPERIARALPDEAPVIELAKFQLQRHLRRSMKKPCPDCNATKIQWTDAPGRPGAKLGICPRCALVRFDFAYGQLFPLAKEDLR